MSGAPEEACEEPSVYHDPSIGIVEPDCNLAVPVETLGADKHLDSIGLNDSTRSSSTSPLEPLPPQVGTTSPAAAASPGKAHVVETSEALGDVVTSNQLTDLPNTNMAIIEEEASDTKTVPSITTTPAEASTDAQGAAADPLLPSSPPAAEDSGTPLYTSKSPGSTPIAKLTTAPIDATELPLPPSSPPESELSSMPIPQPKPSGLVLEREIAKLSHHLTALELTNSFLTRKHNDANNRAQAAEHRAHAAEMHIAVLEQRLDRIRDITLRTESYQISTGHEPVGGQTHGHTNRFVSQPDAAEYLDFINSGQRGRQTQNTAPRRQNYNPSTFAQPVSSQISMPKVDGAAFYNEMIKAQRMEYERQTGRPGSDLVVEKAGRGPVSPFPIMIPREGYELNPNIGLPYSSDGESSSPMREKLKPVSRKNRTQESTRFPSEGLAVSGLRSLNIQDISPGKVVAEAPEQLKYHGSVRASGSDTPVRVKGDGSGAATGRRLSSGIENSPAKSGFAAPIFQPAFRNFSGANPFESEESAGTVSGSIKRAKATAPVDMPKPLFAKQIDKVLQDIGKLSTSFTKDGKKTP